MSISDKKQDISTARSLVDSLTTNLLYARNNFLGDTEEQQRTYLIYSNYLVEELNNTTQDVEMEAYAYTLSLCRPGIA